MKNIYWFIVLIFIIFVLSCNYLFNQVENFENIIKIVPKYASNKNHIDMLTYSSFKPECCPSVYSNSKGCLCYNDEEYLTLVTRGGNRFFTQNDAYIQSITRDKRNKYVNPELL